MDVTGPIHSFTCTEPRQEVEERQLNTFLRGIRTRPTLRSLTQHVKRVASCSLSCNTQRTKIKTSLCHAGIHPPLACFRQENTISLRSTQSSISTHLSGPWYWLASSIGHHLFCFCFSDSWRTPRQKEVSDLFLIHAKQDVKAGHWQGKRSRELWLSSYFLPRLTVTISAALSHHARRLTTPKRTVRKATTKLPRT